MKSLLSHICSIYDELVDFLYDAGRKVVSNDNINYSRFEQIKSDLAASVACFKKLNDKNRFDFENGKLGDDIMKLKKKISLYNKVAENFLELVSDGMQFYNELMMLDGSLYNSRGGVSLGSSKTISVKA